jgi:hypothetical protein
MCSASSSDEVDKSVRSSRGSRDSPFKRSSSNICSASSSPHKVQKAASENADAAEAATEPPAAAPPPTPRPSTPRVVPPVATPRNPPYPPPLPPPLPLDVLSSRFYCNPLPVLSQCFFIIGTFPSTVSPTQLTTQQLNNYCGVPGMFSYALSSTRYDPPRISRAFANDDYHRMKCERLLPIHDF